MQIWFRLFLRSIANTKFPEAFCICNLQIWMQREVQKGLMHTLWKLTNLSWLLLALFLPPQNIFWVTCNQNPFMVQAHTGDTFDFFFRLKNNYRPAILFPSTRNRPFPQPSGRKRSSIWVFPRLFSSVVEGTFNNSLIILSRTRGYSSNLNSHGWITNKSGPIIRVTEI